MAEFNPTFTCKQLGEMPKIDCLVRQLEQLPGCCDCAQGLEIEDEVGLALREGADVMPPETDIDIEKGVSLHPSPFTLHQTQEATQMEETKPAGPPPADTPVPEVHKCRVPDCPEKATKSGYCKRHHHTWYQRCQKAKVSIDSPAADKFRPDIAPGKLKAQEPITPTKEIATVNKPTAHECKCKQTDVSGIPPETSPAVFPAPNAHTPPSVFVTLDFEGYPALADKLVAAAKADFRNPDQQVLAILAKNL